MADNVQKRKLLSLIGKLSFAAKVVPAGRLFLRKLIDLSTKVKKLHHRVSLTACAKADIQWWLNFLPSWNGVSLMLQPNWEPAPDLNLFTDASGSIGYGAYFQGAWIAETWGDQHLRHSIQWKELFAILAATATWGDQWSGKKIRFYCDNQAVVKAWQSKAPKNHNLANLYRKLFLLAAKNNFNISLTHIPGFSCWCSFPPTDATVQRAGTRRRKRAYQHPCLADRTLTKTRRALRNNAIADSTRQAYQAGFQRYVRFCRKYRLKPLPTDEETLSYFVAHL